MEKTDYCGRFQPGGIADKIAGVVFGQALGDAVGLITEFQEKIPLEIVFPYTESIRNVPVCDWTDDTDLMIVSMISLMENNMVFSPHDLAARFKNWSEHGMTFLGDKEPTTPNNMFKFIVSQADYVKNPMEVAAVVTKSANNNACNNSPISRIAIISALNKMAAPDFCSITHPDPRCVASCVFYTSVMSGFIHNSCKTIETLDEIVKFALATSIEFLDSTYRDEFTNIINGRHTLRSLRLGEISKSSHIYKCLSCVVYTISIIRVSIIHKKTPSWKKTVAKIVLEGGDADANAAVTGAVLGAFLGKSQLPVDWVSAMPYFLPLSQFTASFISKLMNPTTIEENAEAAGEPIDKMVALVTGDVNKEHTVSVVTITDNTTTDNTPTDNTLNNTN